MDHAGAYVPLMYKSPVQSCYEGLKHIMIINNVINCFTGAILFLKYIISLSNRSLFKFESEDNKYKRNTNFLERSTYFVAFHCAIFSFLLFIIYLVVVLECIDVHTDLTDLISPYTSLETHNVDHL